jgi:hypothetical protein
MTDEPTTTYFQHQQNQVDEVGGRYAKLSNPTVTGTTPIPQQPSGPEWSSSAMAVPDEPPLGCLSKT